MFSGVLALLERSLRVDSRAWGPHLARFGLMAGIYVAVCYANATSAFFGAPGLRFFEYIVYLNLTFMTLTGIGFFSTAITEEKEEDTLGLMLMAGISPLGILLGKSTGRLVQALLLIAVQYPFTLLAVTMGGVTHNQLSAAYASMFAYMIFLAGLGLLCSTLASRNRTASFRMTIVTAAYFAVPLFCAWNFNLLGGGPYFSVAFKWIAESCVFLQIGEILTSGTEVRIFSRQVVTNLTMGFAGFLLSWALFGFATRVPTGEATSRGLVSRNRGLIRVFSPGRPYLDALVWKDFHFGAGGFAALLIRTILFVSLYGLIVAATEFGMTGLPLGPARWYGATGAYLALMMFAVSIDAGLLLSRCLHDEVRGQTLAALMMLPKSTGMILYPKMLGSLLCWLPGPICLLLGIFVLPEGLRCTREFFHRPGPPFLFIAFFVLAPHFAALSAMYVRWGALPVGIGLTIGMAFLTAGFITAFRIGPGDPSVFLLGSAIYFLSLACHVAVWLRAESLSAR